MGPTAAQVHIDGYGEPDRPRKKSRRKAKRKMKLVKASDRPFSADPGDYSDGEWERACILDRGEHIESVKKRYAIPIREPDGDLNANGLRAASEAIRKAAVHELTKDALHRRLAKRLTKAGLPTRIVKAKLSTERRNSLPDSDFVFPATREYPIPDESHARNALSRGAQNESGARLETIRRKVRDRFPNIDVSKADLELQVPLWKDDAKQLVYGVVLTPGVVDSQGDVASPEEIQKTAHRFLTEYREHDVQHAEAPADVETVESFIAPSDMEIAGQPVLKGAWVMVTHVKDPAVWEMVRKGEITGYSIGGTGERIPLAA